MDKEIKIQLALDYICDSLAEIERNIERGYDKKAVAFCYGFDSGGRHYLEFVKYLLTEKPCEKESPLK